MDSSKKPPLLFVHGFRGDPYGFKAIIKNLSKDFSVYSPSIPPFGDSLPLVEYTPDSYAVFLADYIKNNHLENPVLIGHSMGSIIAAATAEKFPNLVNKKLILLAPISKKTPKYTTLVQPFIAFLPNKAMSRLSTRFLIVPKDRELYKEALEATIICGKKYTTRKDVISAASFSSKHSISDFNLKNDVLLLAGEKDRLIKNKKTTKLAHAKNYSLKFIKNSGHLLNYEQPNAVSDAIREFLAQ